MFSAASKTNQVSQSNTAAPVIVTDPLFNGNSLLLHGNGTDGSQNQTILESSNNTPVNVVGKVSQGSFSPYNKYGSVAMNSAAGQVGWVRVTNTLGAALNQDFTVECWAMRKQISSLNALAMTSGSAASSTFPRFASAGNWAFLGKTITAAEADARVFAAIGKWFHIALVRQSGSIYAYINGVLVGTPYVYTNALGFGAGTSMIGNYSGNVNQEWIGYISNYRIVIGEAVYTSNFTPSTTPLTATANTKLLLFQDGNNFLKDASSNNNTFIYNGKPQSSLMSPFAPTQAYDTSLGGSVYLGDATGYMYLNSPSPVPAGQNVTVETWFYPTVTPTGVSPYLRSWIFCTSENITGCFGVSFDSTLAASAWLDNFYASSITTTNKVVMNSWNHVALVKIDSTIYLYLNGIRATTTGTQSTDFGANTALYLGEYPGNIGEQRFSGYISDFRYVRGTAVYTNSTLTMPTERLGNITNTAVLLSMTNAGIVDNAKINNFEVGGSVRIGTTQSKFGTGSIYFPGGSGNYLKANTNMDHYIGTGEFSIETWVYPTQAVTSACLLSTIGPATTGGGWEFRLNTSSLQIVTILGPTVRATGTFTITPNTWTHLAATRSNGFIKLYANGTLLSNTSATSTFGQTGLYIGSADAVGTRSFVGYMDDFRFTPTAERTITLPTEEYPNL